MNREKFIVQLSPERKKRLAALTLAYARKDGVLSPTVCGQCESTQNIHAHHPDYDNPLLVEFLCAKCHAQEHGNGAGRGLSRQRKKQLEYFSERKCINCGNRNPRSPLVLCQSCSDKSAQRVRNRLGIKEKLIVVNSGEMTFPEQLKRERKRLRLTQVEAAKFVGVSRSALEKWESNVRIPNKFTQEGILTLLTRTLPLKPKQIKK